MAKILKTRPYLNTLAHLGLDMPEIKFIDLEAQFRRLEKDIKGAIDRVLCHCNFILGPEIHRLEEELGKFTGVKHVVTCSSGTDALLMSLMAYDVKMGDIIITTPFTFIATSEVISLLKATPVFVDIREDTFNIDPVRIDEVISSSKVSCAFKIRGIISVNLFGLPCDYDELREISRKYNLFLIEDAAQSFGAEYKGRMSCSLGDIGCTSFYPSKPLSCYGDGGAIFTDDDEICRRLLSIRVHGQGNNRYESVTIGINGRLDTIQAAILLEKLRVFKEELEKRREIAKIYTEQLNDVVITPKEPSNVKSAWAHYSILLENEDVRARLISYLKNRGIPTNIYYPIPLHLQPAFSYLGYKPGNFPVAESVSKRILSLPLHPYLSNDAVNYICESIRDFFGC